MRAQLARQHRPETLLRLVQPLRGDDTRIAVMAAERILDRAYGKPVTPIGGDVEAGPIRIEIGWQGDGEGEAA